MEVREFPIAKPECVSRFLELLISFVAVAEQDNTDVKISLLSRVTKLCFSPYISRRLHFNGGFVR